MFNKLKLLILTFFIAFCFPQFINAKDQQIKVAIDSWPPFRILENEEYRGIDADILREIEKRLNLKFSYEKYPWARILHNLKNGGLDTMSGLAKREERAQYLHYTSIPYYTCSTVFYVKKGNSQAIKSYEDLYKHSIAFVKDSAYFKKFDNDIKLNKYPVTSEIQLLKMLQKDRVDTIIGTDCQADYEIKKLGLKDMFEKAEYRPNNNVDLYFVISKKSKFSEKLNVLNNVIKELKEEGKIQEFAKKYYE